MVTFWTYAGESGTTLNILPIKFKIRSLDLMLLPKNSSLKHEGPISGHLTLDNSKQLHSHAKIGKTMILMTNGSLIKVKSIAECS